MSLPAHKVINATAAVVTTQSNQDTDVKEKLDISKSIKAITWMTGTNGRFLLPTLKYTKYKLMATGKLLEQNIAPFGGELCAGISIRGVNHTVISGVGLGSSHDFEHWPWKYAKLKSDKTLKDLENELIAHIEGKLSQLEKVYQSNQMFEVWHAEIVNFLSIQLLQLRQLNEQIYIENFKHRLESLLPAIQNDALWKPLQEYQRILGLLTNTEPLTKIDINNENESIPKSELEKINKILTDKGYPVGYLSAYLKYNLPLSARKLKEKYKYIIDHTFIEDFLEEKISELIMLARIFFPNIHLEDIKIEDTVGIRMLKYFECEHIIDTRVPNVIREIIKSRYLDPFNRARARLVNTKPSIIFSKEDKKFMEEHPSFPLVLASTKPIKSRQDKDVDCLQDIILGQDIDLIITDQANEGVLRQYLAGNGLNQIQVCTNDDFLRVLRQINSTSSAATVTYVFDLKKQENSVNNNNTSTAPKDSATAMAASVSTESNKNQKGTSDAKLLIENQELNQVLTQNDPKFSKLDLLAVGCDHRRYRLIRLKNGLKALLISNNRAIAAFAHLDIDIGSFEEPDETPGLAHFLEHMVFMGSQKYPNEKEYKEYLGSHSGGFNATTYGESTTFYFSIDHAYFEGALDRLSSFFVNSLLKANCAEREVNAVDNEFKGKLNQDGFNLLHVNKLFMNPSHPDHRFNGGNKETLKISDELLAALRKFHESYYTADRMILVLDANNTLDNLEKLANDYFSAIPKAAKPFLKPKRPLRYLKSSIGNHVQLKSVQNENLLIMTFTLNEPVNRELRQACYYISFMLNHRTEGCLLEILKIKGLVKDVSTLSVNYSVAPAYPDFQQMILTINLPLTKLGCSNSEAVVAEVLDYIHFIKKQGIEDRYFKEIQERDARMVSTSADNLGDAEGYADNLKYWPVELLFTGHLILPGASFPKDKISSVLGWLIPENMNVTIVLDEEIPKAKCKEEPITKAQYAIAPLSPRLMQWQATDNLAFQLPRLGNRFTPKDFNIKPQFDCFRYPILILNENRLRIFVSQDLHFKKPLIDTFLFLNTSISTATPETYAMSNLYLLLFNIESQKRFSREFNIVNARHTLNLYAKGFCLNVSGHSDKHSEMVLAVVQAMIEYKPNIKDFEEQRKTFENALLRMKTDPPLQQCHGFLGTLLNARDFTNESQLKAIKELQFQTFLEYIHHLMQSFNLEVYSHGNITPESSIQIGRAVFDSFSPLFTGKTKHLSPKSVMVRLPAGFNESFTMATSLPSHAVVLHLQPADNTLKTRQLLALLAMIIEPKFWQQLRTEQQLAYDLRCSLERTEKAWGISFSIESPQYKPAVLIKRIQAFLINFEKELSIMEEASFNTTRDSYVVVLKRSELQPSSVTEVAGDFFVNFESSHYQFTKGLANILKLEKLTLAELRVLYKQLIAKESCRSLIIKTENAAAKSDAKSDPTFTADTKSNAESAVEKNDALPEIDAVPAVDHAISDEVAFQRFRSTMPVFSDIFAAGERYLQSLLEFNRSPDFTADRMSRGELVEMDEDEISEALSVYPALKPEPVKNTIIAYCFTRYQEEDTVALNDSVKKANTISTNSTNTKRSKLIN